MAPRYPESPADILAHEDRIALSGIDYLNRVIAGALPAAAVSRTLNIELIKAEPGRVEIRGLPGFEHTNSFGAVHGGWYAALLDTCLGFAVISGLKPGQHHTTLDLSVNMIRAIPMNAEVIAVGLLDHGGRSTGVARGEIRSADGKTLYAIGTTTCLVMGTATAPAR